MKNEELPIADSPLSIIQLSDISAAYDGKAVLNGVNLSVYECDFLGIVGPNGGGKTSLVRLMLGLQKPTSGSIRFLKDGQEVPQITMGYLPQYNSIDRKFPISVYEVVLSGLSKEKSLLQKYSPEQHEQVRRIIARMGLEGMEHRAIGELSGGQLQRTLLGRALVSNPEVVILDEPDTYIDRHFKTKLYSLLEEINSERAILLISHDISTVLDKVNAVACVNGTVDYFPHAEIPADWLDRHF